MATPAEWAGLAARSESDRPHEWPAIITVLRNRVEAAGFSSTMRGVITAPWQFSYFNQWRGEADLERVYSLALEGYAGDRFGENSRENAVECASWVLDLPRWRLPFGPRVYNFWSPISMVPRFSRPRWDFSGLREFTVPGIDPDRFIFAETVR